MRLAVPCSLLALVVLLGVALPVSAAGPYTVEPLGRDPARQVDRYRVTIGPGGSLWDLATSTLPEIALNEGDGQATSYVEQAFSQAYPDRPPGVVRSGDTLVLEVPAGAFVTREQRAEGETIVYTSFGGDLLTRYTRNPVVVYRLVRASQPSKAEVLVRGSPSADPVEAAKVVYGVEAPDFLQVRAMRGALGEPSARLTVDLQRPYLDAFRNWRDRAVAQQPGPSGMTSYLFDRNETQAPYLRVDDAVGDGLDPAQFPQVFRVEYYRDGTVKEYRFVETGDTLARLARPRNDEWSKIVPNVSAWEEGRPGPLEPFAPAISQVGVLLPGRILVLTWSPRAQQDDGALGELKGVQCFGIPVALVFGAGVLELRRRRSQGSGPRGAGPGPER